MTDFAFAHIAIERQPGVAWIVLSEPSRLNAIDHGPGSMEDEIVRALALLEADDDVRCVVVTGAGRAFSSGGHMALAGLETPVDHLRFLDVTNRANEEIRTFSKPTIGAINGICYGAALILALHLDLLVAVEDARFGLIETRFGAVGVEMLAFAVGLQWARFLALSGELISAERAKSIGLVLEVFPRDTFTYKVEDLARRIAAMPQHGVVLNRRLVNGAAVMMGWLAQKELATAINALTSSMVGSATAADGRRFSQILEDDGWQAFKDARDAAFHEPWLDE